MFIFMMKSFDLEWQCYCRCENNIAISNPVQGTENSTRGCCNNVRAGGTVSIEDKNNINLNDGVERYHLPPCNFGSSVHALTMMMMMMGQRPPKKIPRAFPITSVCTVAALMMLTVPWKLINYAIPFVDY